MTNNDKMLHRSCGQVHVGLINRPCKHSRATWADAWCLGTWSGDRLGGVGEVVGLGDLGMPFQPG